MDISKESNHAVESFTEIQMAEGLFLKLREGQFNMSSITLEILDKHLSHSLSLLRTTANSRLPINKLPMEILSQIFQCVPSQVYVHGHRIASWPPSHIDTDELIPLTRVCRHWRDVALGSSALWTSVCDTPQNHCNTSRALS
ncbi:hypothetical protein A0H81_05324 [Grifola frondosa]|uniref:F-box domain-containing protein n=1 Tax=Grifola frondosa TaxID=5627 RepID=A0A1C7MDB4_GRIFR|nr:hypothetical protein A0H81_05324 [Grifola frondosa]